MANEEVEQTMTLNEEATRQLGEIKKWGDLIVNQMMSRTKLLESMLDPRRDVNKECGYPETAEISFSKHYRPLWDRLGIAKRVVGVEVAESWKLLPEIYESEDEEETTAFERSWHELCRKLRGGSKFQSTKTHPIWSMIERLDKLSGIGSFGCLLLGLNDGKDLSQPAPGFERMDGAMDGQSVSSIYRGAYGEAILGGTGSFMQPVRNAGKKKPELLYLRVFHEGQIQISQFEDNKNNPRYGMPKMYTLTMHDPLETSQSGLGLATNDIQVHWSRVIHAADNRESSEWSGIPRMQPVLNHLLDLVKLYGGSTEMYWQGAFPGLSLETHPTLGGDVNLDMDNIREQLSGYMNSLQRSLAMAGVSVKMLSPTVVSPDPQINNAINAICITLGIPRRIFEGSERGELASSQDKDSWEERLSHRRETYITPELIVTFVDRLIQLRVLEEPESWTVSWEKKRELDETQRAATALQITQALAAYVAGGLDVLMTPLDYLVVIHGFDRDLVTEVLENAIEHINEANPDLPDVTVPGKAPVAKEEPQLPGPVKVKEGEQLVDPRTGQPVGDPSQTRDLTTNKQYASTQINAPKRIRKQVRALHRVLDAHDVLKLENEPHVTVHYGIEGDKLEDIQSVVEGVGEVAIQLGPLQVFQNEEQDVLYASVRSKKLQQINELVKGATNESPTYKDYKPHMTIAYLKPGAGAKYAQRFADFLKGAVFKSDSFLYSDTEENKSVITLNYDPRQPRDKNGRWTTTGGGGGGGVTGAPAPSLWGNQPTAVLRWMGANGWSKEEAARVMEKRGVSVSKNTVQIQVAAGKKGKGRGDPAALTKEQAEELERDRKGGGAVLPPPPPKESKSKKRKPKPKKEKKDKDKEPPVEGKVRSDIESLIEGVSTAGLTGYQVKTAIEAFRDNFGTMETTAYGHAMRKKILQFYLSKEYMEVSVYSDSLESSQKRVSAVQALGSSLSQEVESRYNKAESGESGEKSFLRFTMEWQTTPHLKYISSRPEARRAKVIHEVLSEIRPMGGTMQLQAGDDPVKDTGYPGTAASPEVMNMVADAAKALPKSWIDGTRRTIGESKRGYHSASRSYLCISGFNRESRYETAVHELGHAAEARNMSLGYFQQAFKDVRRKGEKNSNIYPGANPPEMGFKDDFHHHYVGKDYGGRHHEVLTMGIQEVLRGKPRGPEGAAARGQPLLESGHYDFTLGMLVSL